MADTTVKAANRVKQWAMKFFTEYVRANRFKRYMGTDENAIIHMKEDLTKKKGDALTFSLVNALSNNGVEGGDTLDGNEEALNNDGHQISVYHLRNAVTINLEEEQAAQIDFFNAEYIINLLNTFIHSIKPLIYFFYSICFLFV